MKSNINRAISKIALDGAIQYIPNDSGTFDVLLNKFAKDLVDTLITNTSCFVKKWTIDSDNMWTAHVRTFGGRQFNVVGKDINDCIHKINSNSGE